MDYLFFELLLSGVGKIFMTLRYRDKEKIEKILDEKYEGRFSAVGLVLALNTIAGLGFIGIVSALFFVIYMVVIK